MMAECAKKSFFHAVIACSSDGDKIDKQEFEHPVRALFYIFHGMSAEDRVMVSTLITERAQSRVRPADPLPKVKPP